MAFDGSGTFTMVYTWATEAGSPPIAIAKLDTEMTNIAAGLSGCILRNGAGKPTAEMDWNAQKLSNLANSTTRTGAPSYGQVQDSASQVLGSVSGADTITAALTPAITAYAAGQRLVFEPASNNTGAATLNVNSVGAKDIKKWDGDALDAGDLVANVPATVVYDGTQFVLQNPLLGFEGWPAGVKVGYRTVPQNAQTGNYTCLITDDGKHLFHASGAGASDTYTIPANASVAFPIGATISFVNLDSNAVSIAITSDTMYLAGPGTTGTRTLAQYGMATALKVTSTAWVISGAGLS